MLLSHFCPIVPTGPPQGVEVQSETSTTLVLSWQPPAPENQNGIIVHYIVNITEMETGRLLSFTAVNMTTLSVPMLHPFYTYTCIVAAVTVGIGPYSATVEVELPEDGKQVYTVEPPLSGLQTYGHLLLPGTIFSHTKLNKFPVLSQLRVLVGRVTCVNSVFSIQPQCLHSLHSVVLSPSGFSKDAHNWVWDTILYTTYRFLSYRHFLSYGHPLVPCCPDERFLP